MLKITMFFLLGCCSFCFAQFNGNTVSIDGNGTKTTSTNGEGSGSGNNLPNLFVVQRGNDLILSLSRQEAKFNSFSLYGGSGITIFEDRQIRSTNSYSIDVSNLKPGIYYVSVEVITPTNMSISHSFVKL